MEISEALDAQITEGMNVSGLCRADVIQEALRVALPQFIARFQTPSLGLEERIREALAEPAEAVSKLQFEKNMAAIADGR